MALSGNSQMITSMSLEGTSKMHSDLIATANDITGVGSAANVTGQAFVQVGERTEFLRQRFGGLRGEVGSLRNSILLMVFATAGATRELVTTADAASKMQVAYEGVRAMALATGNNIDDMKTAVMGLTKDGLLTMAEASMGLKNLLASGLSLPQAINLMNTFKDSAAFNRRGELEFGDAIVRATEGIKNHNARAVQAVGIVGKFNEILKQSGFSLSDLTNAQTKSAAMQALYNGLMQRGSIFLGDAERYTNTYAGAQVRLETQLTKTKAAFGEILIGGSGIFTTLQQELTRYLSVLQENISINKEYIGIRLKEYFDQIRQSIEGVASIVKAFASPFIALIDAVNNLGLTKWIAWGLVVEILIGKFKVFEASFLNFFGQQATATALSQTISFFSTYGANVDKVSNSLKALRNTASASLSLIGRQFPKEPDIAVAKGIATANAIETGTSNIPPNLQAFQYQVALFKKNYEQSVKDIQNMAIHLNLGNIDEFSNKLKVMAAAMPATRDGIREVQQNIIVFGGSLKNLAAESGPLINIMTAAWRSLEVATSAAATAVVGFLKANAPMLIFQAALAVGVALWESHAEAIRDAAAAEERLKQIRADQAQKAKDIFDSRMAEITSIGGLLTEYQDLNEHINKTSDDTSRMIEIQKQINDISTKYGLTLNANLQSTKDITHATDAYQEALKGIDSQLIKNEIQRLENQRSDVTFQTGTKIVSDVQHTIDLVKKAIDVGQPEIANKLSSMFTLTQGANSGKPAQPAILTERFAEQLGPLKGITATGTEILNIYSDIVKKLNDTNQAYHAGLGILSEKELTNLDNGVISLTRLKASFDSLGFSIDDSDEKIKALRDRLDEVQGKAGQAPISDKFLIWMNNLQGMVDKNAGVGNITKAIIEMQTKIKDLNAQLDTFGKKGLAQETVDKAKNLIAALSRQDTTQAIKATADNYKILNEQVDSNLEKMKESETHDKHYEQVAQNIRSIGGLQKTLDDLTQASTKSHSVALKQLVIDFTNLIVKQKLINQLTLDEIDLRVRLKDNQDDEKLNQEIAKNTLEYKKQLATLSAIPEQTAKINLNFEHQQKLMELVNEQTETWSEIQLAIRVNDDAGFARLTKKQLLLNNEVDQENYIYSIKVKQLSIEEQLNLTIEKRSLETKQSFTGGFGTIGNIVGQTLGGGATGVQSIVEAMNAQQDLINKHNAEIAKAQAGGDRGHQLDQDLPSFQENQDKFVSSLMDSNQKIAESYATLFGGIITQVASVYDIWGTKSKQASDQIAADTAVQQALNDKDFQDRTISVQQYAATRTYLAQVAAIEETKQSQLSAANQKLAIGSILTSLAEQFTIKAMGAAADALVASVTPGLQPTAGGLWAAAAEYSAAAVFAGGAGIAFTQAGNSAVTQANAQAQLAEGIAQKNEQIAAGTATIVNPNAQSPGQTISGQVSAQNLNVTIAPVITIQGEYISISNQGVEEAASIIGDYTVDRIQEALNNNELQLPH